MWPFRGETSACGRLSLHSNYAIVLNDTSVWRSFMISVFVTVVGTGINLIATASLAYPLSRNEYRGRKAILMLVLVTFIFSAPLIPNYLLIKSLNMLDTVWALIIPGAISAYNLFIMRSFFMNLPNEIIDSARIDGCGELRIISSIVAFVQAGHGDDGVVLRRCALEFVLVRSILYQ